MLKKQARPIEHLTDFAAIDFETANNYPSSICSVGVVVVRNGIMVDEYYSLVKPEPEYYLYWNTRVHGIRREDTEKERVFPYVWRDIEPLIEGLPLVAHNKQFDESCLKSVFRTYRMDYPDYQFYCTYRTSLRAMPDLENHKLDTVAASCGFLMDHHHHALNDAEACAAIAIRLFGDQ